MAAEHVTHFTAVHHPSVSVDVSRFSKPHFLFVPVTALVLWCFNGPLMDEWWHTGSTHRLLWIFSFGLFQADELCPKLTPDLNASFCFLHKKPLNSVHRKELRNRCNKWYNCGEINRRKRQKRVYSCFPIC